MKKMRYIAGIAAGLFCTGAIVWSVFVFQGTKHTPVTPTSSVVEDKGEKEPIILCELDAGGTISINGIPVPIDTFEAYLAQARHEKGTNRLTIRYVDTVSNAERVEHLKCMAGLSNVYMTIIKGKENTQTGGGRGNPHDISEMTFVTISGGTFYMGEKDESLLEFCRPVHMVILSSFEMSIYEVTNAQYAAYLNAALASGDIVVTSGDVFGKTGDWLGQQYLDIESESNSINKCWIQYKRDTFSVTVGKENWPVVSVSWYGAKAFAEYYDLDLPTEAEWEYACKGGWRQYMYGTVDGTISNNNANYDKNVGHPTDVGSYPANPFGLYDMSGNVFEWCNDWFGDYSSVSVTNPIGPSSGTQKVVRGGCWGLRVHLCKSPFRLYLRPSSLIDINGFRVVRRPGGVTY